MSGAPRCDDPLGVKPDQPVLSALEKVQRAFRNRPQRRIRRLRAPIGELVGTARSSGGVSFETDQNKRPAAGSPADTEAGGELFAGEWGLHPARDVVATLLMECWSCADHLKVAGTVLAGDLGIASLYTLTRGAAEAAVTARYLSDPEIDPLERVRRLMNHNLSALREDLNMLGRLPGEDAAAQAARHHAQE
jgi:hypothetical protein